MTVYTASPLSSLPAVDELTDETYFYIVVGGQSRCISGSVLRGSLGLGAASGGGYKWLVTDVSDVPGITIVEDDIGQMAHASNQQLTFVLVSVDPPLWLPSMPMITGIDAGIAGGGNPYFQINYSNGDHYQAYLTGAVDPAGSSAAALAFAAGYTDASVAAHATSSDDPHGDRAYTDAIAAEINDVLASTASLSEIDNSIAAHSEAADPHGDRAYTDAAIAAINLFYMGTHTSAGALETAYPTAESGNWAIVDVGGSTPPRVWLWDVDDGWVEGSDTAAANTDALAEGLLNLYFTAARARDAVVGDVAGLLKADGAGGVSAATGGVDFIAPDDLRTVVNTRTTAAWTVTDSEVTPHGKFLVSVVHGGACSCELLTPTTLGKSPGDKVSIMQGGVGALTITDGAGASLIGNAVFSAQYEIKTCIALDGDTWLLTGAQ